MGWLLTEHYSYEMIKKVGMQALNLSKTRRPSFTKLNIETTTLRSNAMSTCDTRPVPAKLILVIHECPDLFHHLRKVILVVHESTLILSNLRFEPPSFSCKSLGGPSGLLPLTRQESAKERSNKVIKLTLPLSAHPLI